VPPASRRNLKMEAACSCKTSVTNTKQYDVTSEKTNANDHRRESRSYFIIIIIIIIAHRISRSGG
jgi:hypothetical protein